MVNVIFSYYEINNNSKNNDNSNTFLTFLKGKINIDIHDQITLYKSIYKC